MSGGQGEAGWTASLLLCFKEPAPPARPAKETRPAAQPKGTRPAFTAKAGSPCHSPCPEQAGPVLVIAVIPSAVLRPVLCAVLGAVSAAVLSVILRAVLLLHVAAVASIFHVISVIIL